MTEEEYKEQINRLLRENAELRDKVNELADAAENILLLHSMEHAATGSGRVIDPVKASSTPCKCFRYDSDEFCWSPGILGLMSSKKNPEQIGAFCAVGKEYQESGTTERFKKFQEAISKAQEKYEAEGGGVPEWWEDVSHELEKAGITI